MWVEDLREEVWRGQARAISTREEPRQTQTRGVTDEAVARADTLVRGMLDQMNQRVLGGRGYVWATSAAWGVYLWELWWEPSRERGPYLLVTLLRDSRGTPYLRVSNRRLALEDIRLERRLQRALRAAFLQPRVYTPRALGQAEGRNVLRPALQADDQVGDGSQDSQSQAPLAPSGTQSDTVEMEGHRRTTRGRRNGRAEA